MTQKNTISCEEISDMSQSIVSISNPGTLKAKFFVIRNVRISIEIFLIIMCTRK